MRSLVLALVFVLSLSGSLMAQEPAPVLVTLQSQQRQGTFQTGSWTVPAQMTGSIRVTLQLDAAAHTDPTLSVWMRFYFLNDGGQWQFIKGARWTGDSGTVPGQMIGSSLKVYVPDPANPTQALPGTPDFRGRQLRAEVDIPNRLRVGCVVDNPQRPLTDPVQQ